MSAIAAVEEMRGRVRDKIRSIISRIRERIRGQVNFGQIQVGKGALIQEAKSKLTNITAKVQELRPGILPKVAEFKPGTILQTVSGQKVRGETVERGSMSISNEAAKREFMDSISIET